MPAFNPKWRKLKRFCRITGVRINLFCIPDLIIYKKAKEPFSRNNWLQHIEPVIIFVEEKNGSLKSEYNFQQLTTKYDTRIQPEKKKIEKILQDYCSEN